MDVLYAPFVSFAFGRAVKELEAQLEFERVRREKLESQLDDYRAEISHLRERLEKTCKPPAALVRATRTAPFPECGTETCPTACAHPFLLRFHSMVLGNTRVNVSAAFSLGH